MNPFVCFWLVLVGAGCSFVLDPDELVAERRDVVTDTAGEDLEVVDTDGVDTGEDDTADTADTAAETVETVDTADTVDTVEEDTADTSPETVEQDSAEDTADVSAEIVERDTLEDTDPEILDTFSVEVDSETDTGPAIELIVETSGAGNCTLDFYVQGLTNCPKTCGWMVVFDARASRGIASFSWRFSVNGGYIVTPESSVGPVASVVISTPACLFFPAGSMRPATVSASVSTDGGPWVEAAAIPFAVRQVTTCGASMCEAP